MPTAITELSLEPPVPTAYAGAAPDVEIPRDPLDIVLPGTYRDSDVGRPVCLMSKMVSFLIGALDWCLVLAPAVAAFRIYSSVMHQSVAEPGHQILTSFLGATLFPGAFYLE